MQRLAPLDAQLFSAEGPHVPKQVATLAILETDGNPLDHETLLNIIRERIDLVPRYRQKVRQAPWGLGLPLWVDDDSFDLSLHVRRSALPRPGCRQTLQDLVGRLIARRLDQDRPLWELYVIEGLADGGLALLFKSHQALVDGSETVDLAQVLLEETAKEREIPHQEWEPQSAPGTFKIVADTFKENITHPSSALSLARFSAARAFSALPRLASDMTAVGSLKAGLSRNRRFAAVDLGLDDFRRIRDAHGGTINDGILAVIAGAIRSWMLTRAEPVSPQTAVRAMVPMSVDRHDDGMPTSLGPRVTGHLLTLPVGEANAVVRLHQVSFALKAHRETGSATAANRMAGLPGFATSTFHAVGARVAEAESHRGFQLVITNVPGPQDHVYMAGRPLKEVYPAIPLSAGRPLAIGVTSYRGRVFFGLVADREAIGDVDVLAQCLSESLEELAEESSPTRARAPRGRKKPRP